MQGGAPDKLVRKGGKGCHYRPAAVGTECGTGSHARRLCVILHGIFYLNGGAEENRTENEKTCGTFTPVPSLVASGGQSAYDCLNGHRQRVSSANASAAAWRQR